MDVAVNSNSPVEVIDITDQVRRSVAGIRGDALLWLSAPHTTAALMVCEADDKLLRDFEKVGRELVQLVGPFSHDKNDNPNAEAHILSAMIGSTELVPFIDGELSLGTYQHILFFELDGPRERRVAVRRVALASPELEGG